MVETGYKFLVDRAPDGLYAVNAVKLVGPGDLVCPQIPGEVSDMGERLRLFVQLFTALQPLYHMMPFGNIRHGAFHYRLAVFVRNGASRPDNFFFFVYDIPEFAVKQMVIPDGSFKGFFYR